MSCATSPVHQPAEHPRLVGGELAEQRLHLVLAAQRGPRPRAAAASAAPAVIRGSPAASRPTLGDDVGERQGLRDHPASRRAPGTWPTRRGRRRRSGRPPGPRRPTSCSSSVRAAPAVGEVQVEDARRPAPCRSPRASGIPLAAGLGRGAPSRRRTRPGTGRCAATRRTAWDRRRRARRQRTRSAASRGRPGCSTVLQPDHERGARRVLGVELQA